MITLRELARLAAEHADDLDHPVAPFRIGAVEHDTDATPLLMGVVNLSQDSWYRESIAPSAAQAVRRGTVLAAQGAAVVDVGAESVVAGTRRVGPAEQVAALVTVVRDLHAAGVVVSVESYAPEVVAATLAAGAQVLNLTGSADDAAMFDLAAAHDAALVLCHVGGANPRELDGAAVARDPYPAMAEAFAARVADARARGVTAGICLDPGVGFGFTSATSLDRVRHQAVVLLNSFRLRRLGLPICHALPGGLDFFEEESTTAEGFFAVLAALGGTGIHRTHEVARVRGVLAAVGGLSVD